MIEAAITPTLYCNRQFRILYLDHTAKLGGGEIAILNLVKALDQKRFKPVFILASDGPLATQLRDADIETHVYPLSSNVIETRKDSINANVMIQLNKIFECLSYARRIAQFAKEQNIDIIHTNSLKSDIYGGIAGRFAGIPVIWHIRDNIDTNYLPAFAVTVMRFLARVVPNIVVANSESTLKTVGVINRKSTAVVYSGINHQDRINGEVVHDGVSSTTKSRYLELFNRLHQNGHFNQSKAPIIALVGRIAHWKGQHVFIKAAEDVLSKYPNAVFQIIGAPLFGEYDYEKSLHEQVEKAGLTGKVQFLGFRNNIPELLKDIDLLVHASIIGEPFGQVVIEGMAAAKPVIATNGGALPEVVVDGVTGILVPMGDASAMADAIIEVLSHPDRAYTMGLAGLHRVRERFTIMHSVRKIESVYDSIISGDNNTSLHKELSIAENRS